MSTRKKIIIFLISFIAAVFVIVFGLGRQSSGVYAYIRSLLPSSLEKKESELLKNVNKNSRLPSIPYLKLKVPMNNAYLGVNENIPNNGVRRFELLTEKRSAIIEIYTYWGGRRPYFDKETASRFWLDNKILLISWNPSAPLSANPINQPKYRLKNITRGDFDTYINKWIAQMKSWRRPVVIRFAPEMDGDWVPWGTRYNSRSDYKNAYRYIFNKFKKAGVKNVSWMWSPNEAGVANITNWYPGDKYVDWVGLSGFNWGNGKNTTWRSLPQIYQKSFNQLTDIKKPICLAELASAEDKKDPLRKEKWITDTFSEIQNKYPKVKMLVWVNITSHNINWEVDTSPASLASYRKAISNPYYLDKVEVYRP